MEKKLILVVCGAGINTSTMAGEFISEEIAKRKLKNLAVKTILVNDLPRYEGRKDMAIVFMTRIDRDMGVPSYQGMNFLIGTRDSKLELFDKIVASLGEDQQD